MTLKKALLSGLIGAPIGVFISYTITIIVSLSIQGTTDYYPVVPVLSQAMGNEIKAVVLQYFLSALLGFAFTVGSAIFKVEEWSITKQTVCHFLISSISVFPVAYFCYWMDHTVGGILAYIISFVAAYAAIWIVKMLIWKKRIQEINKGMHNNEKV